MPKDGHDELSVVTKATGQGKGRLGIGLHVASYASTLPVSEWPLEPLAQELEASAIGCV